MQTANILLALGGDAGNSVTKYGVTPAEVALLQAIHGDDAVTDIDISDDEAVDENTGRARTNRGELGRLRRIYAPDEMSNGHAVFNSLYPGAAARVFETFDELELPDHAYKAESRATPKAEQPAPAAPAAPAQQAAKTLDDMTKPELVAEAKRREVEIDPAAKKDVILEALRAAEQDGSEQDAEVEQSNDGIGEMRDGAFS